jgi:hypothetical protein
MDGARRESGRSRTGALLLAGQLAAILLLPLAHSHAPSTEPRPHAEAPGTPHAPPHDTPCHVCRIGDGRFAASGGVGLTQTVETGVRIEPADGTAVLRHRQLLPAAAPRPPPHG